MLRWEISLLEGIRLKMTVLRMRSWGLRSWLWLRGILVGFFFLTCLYDYVWENAETDWSPPPSGVPGVVLKSRNDVLELNAAIVGPLIHSCGIICPQALILIVSNPVNALIPFAAEVLRKNDKFVPRQLFGVTSLDGLRAETFLMEALGSVNERGEGGEVVVVGGHSAETIVPLFSRVDLVERLDGELLDQIVHREFLGWRDSFADMDVQLILASAERYQNRWRGGFLGERRESWRHFVDCLCYLPVSLTACCCAQRNVQSNLLIIWL